MIHNKTIDWWKKEDKSFYLGRGYWMKSISEFYKEKNKKNKLILKALSGMNKKKKVKKYKLYEIYSDGTEKDSVATVSLQDITRMTAAGITVLAEKDGFKC